jgi:hypothetical protein
MKGAAMRTLARWQRKMFDAIIAFDTHPLHIHGLVLLGVALMSFQDSTKFELTGGNYTNIISAVVATLVLRESRKQMQTLTEHHEHLKQAHTGLLAEVRKLHRHHGIPTQPEPPE